MKRMVLLLMLLPATLCLSQTASITQCEWYTGSDPGLGLANPIAFGSPNDTASLSFSVATGSFPPGITKIKIRCRADSVRSSAAGVWGVTTDAFVLVSPFTGTARLATQFDYRVDNNAWTPVDVADAASVPINQVVSTAGLAFGLHKLDLRVYDDLGRISSATCGYFFTFDPANPSHARLVTHFEYRVDNGDWSLVDNADASQIAINEIVPTDGLAFGLHRLDIRVTDDLNRLGSPTRGYFFVVDPANPSVARLITQVQYWLDSDAPTTVDVTDAPSVNINQILATAALSVGLHKCNFRLIDDLGRMGPVTSSSCIVTSAFGPGSPRIITAAEFYVNVDPGPGNGVPIPLPVDGIFDESQEDVVGIITGLPVGLHLVGLRVRDNAGRWSARITDSLIVGPVVVARASGNNVVLNWQCGEGANQFKIYRAAAVGGAYALIDSTAAQTYTDLGVIPTALTRYYYATFETSTLSTFRLPSAPRPRE